MLFTDRFSYHFIRPSVGSGILFQTGKVPSIAKTGKPDEYYIKRLVGIPGDILEIKEPVLFRNGEPITGSSAFDLNARRQDKYRGYLNASLGHGEYLSKGQSIVVPPDSFMALGDNSGNSEDSRYWGFIPKEAVIGRPLFTYYPFSRRWGPAH
jgi:signal peptidase I